ncbi:hypothetical protein Hdeb2414_s0011g00364051 [Helianthus debilis subsp. tardiflorus]
MKWLREYKNHQVCLVGDDELTLGRSSQIQVLSGDDWVWFCKVSNPKVFGKPESGKVCIWLSYWPIGNVLHMGDTVSAVMSGLEVHECGASLVYCDHETLENNLGWAEIVGLDLTEFELSTGAYYRCRRDFFSLMEVGRLTPDWFRILVGDTIDYTEVRGWRKTGRPKQVTDPSFTELKAIRCIMDGPELEDVYKIAEMSKPSIGDKTVSFTSSLLEGGVQSSTRSVLIDKAMEVEDEEEIVRQLTLINLKDKSCDLFKVYIYLVLTENWCLYNSLLEDNQLLNEMWGLFLRNCSCQINITDSRSYAPKVKRVRSRVKLLICLRKKSPMRMGIRDKSRGCRHQEQRHDHHFVIVALLKLSLPTLAYFEDNNGH